MAYQQNNPAYQPPPGNYPPPVGYSPYAQSPYPQQQQWGQPPPPQGYPFPPQPQNPHGYPPQQQYQSPPPQGYPPPQAYPPQGYAPPPPQGYPPPPQQGYPPPVPLPRDANGYPPPQPYPPPAQQASYLHPHPGAPHPGAPHPGAPHPGAPPPLMYQLSPPVAPLIIPTADIDIIYKACKGFGTDERALISVFGHRDGPTIDAIRAQYSARTQRDLIATIEKETSGNFRTALKGAAFGPVESEVFFTYLSIAGIGTKEAMLTEAIMGKTNAEINTMKTLYPARYRETLENAVRGDLSMKTEKLFMMALSGTRMDDWVPINQQMVANDTLALHNACKSFGTDELSVCSIITRSSDEHLRAIAAEYQRTYSLEITRLIKKEFSGHMQEALLYIVEGALNKPLRDARLLEDSMKGFGTRDDLLISRLIRAHWNRPHFDQVKLAYRKLYGKDLSSRVKGETSGDYGKMMVALCS